MLAESYPRHGVVYQRELEGVAKPNMMVVLRCFTDAKILWQYTMATGVGRFTRLWCRLNDRAYRQIGRRLNPHFGTVEESGTMMNASTFGVKRSKFKVTVGSNVLENALLGFLMHILKITILNFTKLCVFEAKDKLVRF